MCIFSFVAAPGVSENGKRLLAVEWNKYWNLLHYHLLLQFGNFSAAEKRHTELSRLIEFIFCAGKNSLKLV